MASIKKVGVLGCGLMGSGIAQVAAQAGYDTIVREVEQKFLDKGISGIEKSLGKFVEKGKMKPEDRDAAMGRLKGSTALEDLADCDIVIEAISERMDWKKALYEKVAPHLGEHTIFASNTSGLSIDSLSEAMPAHARARFCGVHFFNPPRYMHLVELIPGRTTDPAILDQLERDRIADDQLVERAEGRVAAVEEHFAGVFVADEAVALAGVDADDFPAHRSPARRQRLVRFPGSGGHFGPLVHA